MKRTLGFFGAGKMAEGIVQAVAASGTFELGSVVMAETCQPRAEEMAKRYGVKTSPSVQEVARLADVIFLAVRPQDVAAVAEQVPVQYYKSRNGQHNEQDVLHHVLADRQGKPGAQEGSGKGCRQSGKS